MKRKRGAGRRKPTKIIDVPGADKETGYQSAWSDAANDLVNSRLKGDMAQANATSSRGPTNPSKGLTTTSRGPTTASKGPTTASKGLTTTSRGPTTASKGPTTASKGLTTTSRGPTALKGPTAGLNNEESKKKTSRGNSLHGNNVFKDVASFAAKLSRAVGSSTSDPHIDARALQDETANAGEQTSSRHDILDNQKELKAALFVIKTIMKMDASKPFNTPVDPVALGIPDYFDVIDSPMDFETICNNIDLGFKYRNSKDIYRDVELIWDNCSKYNKDGTKIMELMKQVRTKFLKQWSAAGLYILRQEPSYVHSGKGLPHAAEDSVRHNYHGHARLDSSAIGDSSHQGRPYLMGQDVHPPHPSFFSYEYRPPHMSSLCSCSWCLSGSQSSMYHNSWHNPPGGSGFEKHYNQRQFEPSSQHEHSHHPLFHDKRWQHQPSFDPHQASLQKARMNSEYPGSSNGYSIHQNPWHMYPNHTDGYHPGLTHADDLHHHSNIPQSPWRAPVVPSTYSAGHPHLNMRTEAIPRHTKRVEEDLTALDPDGPSAQKYQRVAATQAASCSRKYSPARPEEHSGSEGHPHLNMRTEAIPRHTERVEEDLTALDPDCPSAQNYQRVAATQATSCSRKYSPERREENSGSAGHPHLNSAMESIPRHTKRVQEDLIALDPDGPRIQKHQRLTATQVTSSSHQHSPARHEENSDSAGHIHVTPARESSDRTESYVAPDTNNCSSEEYDMDQNEPDPPLSNDNAMPEPEDAHLSQPGSSTPEASPLEIEHTRDSLALEKKSRVRGPTRCNKLLFQGKQISISTNEFGQPVGADARKLTSFLGVMARDGHKAPLNYIDWRAMPEVHKENMWKEVQEMFIIDPKSKTWIMQSLCKKWQSWKGKLKSERYLTCATNEERLANLDERVLPDQWEYLVSYWNTEKAERRSALGKAANAKLVLRHAGGSKSYACIREEEKEKRADKQPPSRAELFIKTRLRKDGTPVNEDVADIIDKLQQTQDAEETSTVQDEAFAQLVGRQQNGRLRCVKLGSSPSELVSMKHSRDVADQLVLEAKAEVIEIKSKMGAMEETCAQMTTQMAAMMSMMLALEKNISNGNMPGTDASKNQGSLGNGWNRPPINQVYLRRFERYPNKMENMGTSFRPGSSAEPNSLPDRGSQHIWHWRGATATTKKPHTSNSSFK